MKYAGTAMKSANRPAKLNRALLGLFGLGLAAAGGLALAAHFGRLNWVGARDALLPNHDAPQTWMLWTAAATAGLAGLGCLRWAIAQVPRTERAIRWQARVKGSTDTTVLDTATMCAPVAADIEAYDGVRSARARLSGPGRGPGLHLVVTASPDIDVPGLRDRIRAHALPRLRQALELDTLPVRMEVRLAAERPRRRIGRR
ncbi:alkaline shock response membrane anchor protein AmaP [Nocardia alni]|uniref:alkaline shock response membrane anchor protein AmaP n=1 Tax=Nocardia alni TaxID=2815723 RepID=UPI0020B3CD7A|nr:alkaline shock response membrane anchor protein AmaP [Nocardia alni]